MLRPAGGERSAAKNSVSSGSAPELPPVQQRLEVAAEPHARDRRAVDELHLDVDADVLELPLNRLRGVLANREARLRDQRERERLAVLRANAVRAGFHPASSSSALAFAGS